MIERPQARTPPRRRRSRRTLTGPERRLWDAYPAGTRVDLGPTESVRAEVIAALLLGAAERRPGLVPAVRLRGASITGCLNISGGSVDCELRLEKCVLEEKPDFSNSATRQIRMADCRMPGFDGGGLHADGYFSLSGSTIDGEVTLTRAKLLGGFRMNGTVIRNPGGYALFGGGLIVEAGTFFRNAELTGLTRLTGARMGGGFFLQGTTLNGQLNADNILVEDQFECSTGFTAEGPIRLRGARVNGTLSFVEGALRAVGQRALHLGYAQISELILTPREPILGEVQLGYSRIDVILDNEHGWPPNLKLNGLVYETLRGGMPDERRLDWVSRDPDEFRPQPYEQLVAYFRRIGREDLARRTQVAKQRARRRHMNPVSRAWGLLLDWTVGYGYRPWIAAVWLAALLTVGTLVFGHVHPHSLKQPDERPHFHAFRYTLDLMLPIETFGQRSAWEPVRWTLWLADGLTVAGWVLATALLAGVARVLRPA